MICFGATQFLMLQSGTPPTVNYVSLVGVPLDDVYIHCQYASNLLHGYSFSFNPGETLTADTSPLWVSLIAIGGLFTSRLELIAITLSILSYLIIAPGVYRASRDVFGLSESHARIAGWAAVLCSRLAWSGMSGMETALSALLMLLTVEEHMRSRQRNILRGREAVWLGLGLLARPEFVFVAVVCALDWLWVGIRKQTDTRNVPMVGCLLLAIASPALLLPMVTQDHFMSHSSLVQGAHISILPNINYLWFAIKVIASNNVVLFGLAAAGLFASWKKDNTTFVFVIAVGLPILQSFVAPQFRHHGRYFFSVFPLIIILGVSGWSAFEQRLTHLTRWRTGIAFALLFAGAMETGRWSLIAAESVRNINDQHLAAVDWLRTNMRPTDILAVDDVGAIGYYLGHPVIDLTGLVSPSIWSLHSNQDSVWEAARSARATLFVIYNRLNPTFFSHHHDSLLLQAQFRVRLPLASSADTILSIYRVKEAEHGS